VGANWFGVAFLLAVGSLVWWLSTGDEVGVFSAVIFAVLSICIAATFGRAGRDRKILAACTAALALIAAAAGLLTAAENVAGPQLVTLFAIGFIAFQLLANTLATRSRS
jgi:hypothetical protein